MASLAELMVTVGADISDFSRGMKRVSKSMSETASQAGKAGVKIGTSFGGIATTIGGVAPAVLALGSSFASAGVGAVGFGAVATSVLGDVFEASKKVEDIDEKLLSADSPDQIAKLMEERKMALSGLSDTQKKSLKSLKDFKAFWGGFTKQFEKPIGKAFGTSLDILKKGFKLFEPAISSVSKVVAGFTKKIENGMDGTAFRSFTKFVNSTAGTAFKTFGTIAGNALEGTLNLLTAFSGMGEEVGGVVVSLTEKFKTWTAKLRELSPSTKRMIVVVGLLVASIAPLLVIVGLLSTGLSLVAGAITAISLPVVAVIAGIVALGVAFVALWKKSETFRNTVTKVFNAIKTKVQQAIGVVVSFLKDKLNMIKKFWDKNGTQILKAVENAFNGIKAVISFVMPVVQGIIKYVWNAIKGIIDGALNVIMGLVKVFTGLFTGNFSKMWSGVKQLFMGAVKFVWNLMNLSFVGGIKKLVFSFAKKIWSKMKGMWDTVRLLFMQGKDKVVGFVGNLKTSALNIFNSLKDKVGSIFNKVKDFITKPIETAKSTVLGIIDKIKGAFSKMKIKIPKPKLPSVSVSMAKGVMGIPFPDFDISWNAKGGIFNGASILGGGQGVGEAGAEAVLPIQHKRYMRPFADAVASQLPQPEQQQAQPQKVTVEVPVNLNGTEVARIVEEDVSRLQYARQKRTNKVGGGRK